MKFEAGYNLHKRKTLDRLAGMYGRRGFFIIQKFFDEHLDEIVRALDNGDEPKINTKSFDKDFVKLLGGHAEKVIDVGISDGIKEVGPKGLHKWAEFPIDMPVELTLDLDEKKEKNKVIGKAKKEIIPPKKSLFKNIFDFTRKQQIKYLQTVYENASKSWVKGQSSIVEVKERMTEILEKSRSSVDRIFRTETTRYFNEARLEYFKEIKTDMYMRLFAITDGRVSGICNSRHGFVVPIEKANDRKYLPPFHPNCRTIQVPLNPKIKRHKALIEKGQAMDESKFVPLIKGWGG